MDTKLCSAVRLAGETVLVVTQTNVDNPLAFACSTIGIESGPTCDAYSRIVAFSSCLYFCSTYYYGYCGLAS